MTTMTPGVQLQPVGQPRPAAGRWRVDPASSHASFAARFAGRPVRGRLPLTGEVLITEPIEDSTARLAATTAAVSTGSPVLDRVLAGPGFLDAGAFPEISFRSELLVWVPGGWRAVGRLQVKNTEHELACQVDLHPGDTRPGDPPSILMIASSWVIDSRWVTRQLIPALGHRIVMTGSFYLAPEPSGPHGEPARAGSLAGCHQANAATGACRDELRRQARTHRVMPVPRDASRLPAV